MDQRLLDVAAGKAPADTVITGGKIVNVYSGEIYEGGVAVCGDKIAAVGDVAYCIGDGTKVIDAGGNYITPGFIDGHMHAGHGVLRGVAQDINAWMMEGMAPFEAARPQVAKDAGARLAIAETIMAGTTTIGDDGSGMRGSLEFIDKAGVRGNVSVRIREAATDYPTPIVPLYTYTADNTLYQAKKLYDSGVYVNPVLPPATAPNECLLRTSYMATHTEALLDEAMDVIAASFTQDER